jgi:hypothetical protein
MDRGPPVFNELGYHAVRKTSMAKRGHSTRLFTHSGEERDTGIVSWSDECPKWPAK